MSELALELIREAKEKQLTHLDLGNCGLVEIPEPLFELTWLKSLNFSHEVYIWNQEKEKAVKKNSSNNGHENKINKIPSNIAILKNLTNLILSNGEIENIIPLRNLVNLEVLLLDENLIRDISSIRHNQKLKILGLSGNHIEDIKPITHLVNLISLNLRGNKVKKLKPLENLKKLENLSLRGNFLGNRTILHPFGANLSPIGKLSSLKSLSLLFNNINNINFISKLENIKDLYLGFNRISNISPIKNLLKLEILSLTSNQVNQGLSALNNLNKIRDLNIHTSYTERINPKFLENKKELVTLTIFNNSHSADKIASISKLPNLEKLEQISLGVFDIKSLNILSNLTSIKDIGILTPTLQKIEIPNSLLDLRGLSINYSMVKEIPELSKLKKIKTLNLDYNLIDNAEPLRNLGTIRELSICQNNLKNIDFIAKLKNLEKLTIDENKIEKLPKLEELNSLHYFSFKKNLIKDLRPTLPFLKNIKRNQINIENFNYTENPLSIPPNDIIKENPFLIIKYFEDLDKQGVINLNEAKLIIVGEPKAGKTTLMETLLNPEFKLSKDTESTLGIEVRENWQFPHPKKPETTFTTNIWDFGGQQIQYMTHQFFLTPGAAYILVSANDRKEPTNFPYWFKIIHLLGEEQGRYSPVIVVLNEKDDKFINKFNFDRKFYEERYPELQITVCEVDLSQQDGQYQAMREQIQKALSNLPHVTDPRPARWKDIRDSLRERAQTADHISFHEYATICSQHEVTEEDSQLLFSGYLHRLGSLLHFSDDPTLHNFIILNPQWAVDAVYSVLNDNQVAKDDGYFSREQVETIWKGKYSFDERSKLLNLMQKENFEICYPLDHDKQRFIAPQLLNAEQPDFIWDEKDNLRFRFQYKFMPEGILTRLIVRLNEILARGTGAEGKQLIWRKGAVFTERGCRARVLEEENRDGLKIIDIAINGKSSERKFLLRRIRDEITGIHQKWFRNIQSEQMIPCTCRYCTDTSDKDQTFFAHKTLLRAQERSVPTMRCDKDFLEVSVAGLLEGVFPANELRKDREYGGFPLSNRSRVTENPSKSDTDIFISYSHKDRFQAAQLVRLLENKGYSIWWDKDLAAGDRFRADIKAKLIAARCVVVLWSQNAIESDWVPEEAGYAYKQKKLVPAMLEAVDLPLPFTGSNAAHLESWIGEENDICLQQLLDGITKLIPN